MQCNRLREETILIIQTGKGWWREAQKLTGVRFIDSGEDGDKWYYDVELEFDNKYTIKLKHQCLFNNEKIDGDDLAEYFFKRINEEKIKSVHKLTIAWIIGDSEIEIPAGAQMLTMRNHR